MTRLESRQALAATAPKAPEQREVSDELMGKMQYYANLIESLMQAGAVPRQFEEFIEDFELRLNLLMRACGVDAVQGHAMDREDLLQRMTQYHPDQVHFLQQVLVNHA